MYGAEMSRHTVDQEETMSYDEGGNDNIIDIITAYKSLKLAMCKNSKGLNIGKE